MPAPFAWYRAVKQTGTSGHVVQAKKERGLCMAALNSEKRMLSGRRRPALAKINHQAKPTAER